MAITKIRGNSQIMDETIGNLQIATNAAIALSKLAKSVVAADGTVAMTGDLALGNNKITGLAVPVQSSDAANKEYVDSVAQGLAIHAPVDLATTAELTATAAGSGIGKTLTGTGALIIDTITATVGMRILVKNQGDGTGSAADNGVYTVTTANPFVLTRATDFDGSPQSEIVDGAFFFVTRGVANGNNGYVLTAANPVVVDGAIDPYTVSDITFIQFSGAGSVVAGDGLTKLGNTVNVGQGFGITVGADTVAVDTAGIAGTGIGTDGNGKLTNTDKGSVAVTAHDSAYDHTLLHTAATAGNGISITGQVVTNSDRGSVAVTSHESAYDHVDLVAKKHDAATAGTGISVTGQVIANTDTGSAAVTAHDSAYDHTLLHAAATVKTKSGLALTGQQLEVLVDGVTITFDGTTGALTAANAGTLAGLGLLANSGALDVNAGDGIEIVADPYDTGKVSVKAGAGIVVDATGVVANVDNTTLEINGSNQIAVKSVGDFLKITKIITREPANGSINGTNATFLLAAVPVLGTEQVFLNGLLQDSGSGNDYTIATDTITFATAPVVGDKIRVTYISQ